MERIPKKLHMYWDKSPMSKLQVFTVESFHKLNPLWEINVYVPRQSYGGKAKYIPDYTGRDYFYLLTRLDYVDIIEVDLNSYGIKRSMHDILRSDILRYNLLYKYGGVWSDFDVIWIRPMDHINNIDIFGRVTHKDMGAMVTFYNTTHGHHNIGVLISTKEHPFYKSIIDETIKIQELYVGDESTFGHQEFGSSMWNSLYPTLNHITDKFEDVVGFRYNTFAPYSIYDISKLYLSKDLSVLDDNNVVGVHWFNGHQLR